MEKQKLGDDGDKAPHQRVLTDGIMWIQGKDSTSPDCPGENVVHDLDEDRWPSSAADMKPEEWMERMSGSESKESLSGWSSEENLARYKLTGEKPRTRH